MEKNMKPFTVTVIMGRQGFEMPFAKCEIPESELRRIDRKFDERPARNVR